MISHLEYVRDQTSVQHRPWHKLIVHLSTQIKCSDLCTCRIMRPINDATLSPGPHEETETSHGGPEAPTNPSSDPSHTHHESARWWTPDYTPTPHTKVQLSKIPLLGRLSRPIPAILNLSTWLGLQTSFVSQNSSERGLTSTSLAWVSALAFNKAPLNLVAILTHSSLAHVSISVQQAICKLELMLVMKNRPKETVIANGHVQQMNSVVIADLESMTLSWFMN